MTSTLRSMMSSGGGAAKLLESQKLLASASAQPSSSGLGPQPTAPAVGTIKQPPTVGKYQPPPAVAVQQQPAPKASVTAPPPPKAMNEDDPQLVVSQAPVAASKFAALGGVKGSTPAAPAVVPDPAPTKAREKKRSKEESSGEESSEGESSSPGEESGSESDGEGEDEGSSSGEEESSEESEGKKQKKSSKPKKAKAPIEKAKKAKSLKPTHEAKAPKKSKKGDSAATDSAPTPAPANYPFTPERTPPVSPQLASTVLLARKPFTKEQEEEIEKFENSNHTHCADMVAKGYRLIHSARYDADSVSFRKDAAEKAEQEEKRKKSSSEDGTPSSDKGRGQIATTHYIKTLAENPYDHFDVWWSDEKQRAYMACTFRVEEFLAQNPLGDGPEAYARVRCVLGKVHARLARSITQRPSRASGTKRVYYTNTVFNEKSFGAGKDLGTTPDNPKWVPEPLWTSEQIKTEVKAAEMEATKRELREQEEKLAEAHEAEKKREKAAEEEKAANKKRVKEEEKKSKKKEKAKSPKKARTEAADVAPMQGVTTDGNNVVPEQNALVSQNRALESVIAHLTVALNTATTTYAANCAVLGKLQHGK